MRAIVGVAMMMGRMVCITDPDAAYFPQPATGGARLDDLLGPGAWLIGRAP